ncbi:MAG: recombination regulator RecX [Tatlockia sp.]|jgi:regulatory protein
MTKAFDCAMRLLCRREHGAFELADKLRQRGYSSEEISEALANSQRLDLQSDTRFAESFCRSRIQQGFGPLKITQELQAKKIDRSLIQTVLAKEQAHWLDYALAVWQKKFKEETAPSYVELQKRQRFLLYRGFPTDLIAKVVAELGRGG